MRIGITALLIALAAVLAGAPRAVEAEDPPAAPRDVDLVLLLDTSASMQALIDAARDKLSRVITSIATATPEPNLRLALLTYGTPASPSNEARLLEGDVVLQSDLTYNFDRVFDRLDDVNVSGGHEYVGSALYHALVRLTWTRNSLRIVFVAGNESADQRHADHAAHVIAKQMRDRDIRLNAIYCGGAEDGISDSWRRLATTAKGRFVSIDHNHGPVTVASPFDAELAALSRGLTRSQALAGLPKTRLALMARVDARAEALGLALAAERAVAKATPLYRAKIPKGAEAAESQAKSLERIRALGQRRAAHVREAMRARGLDDTDAFDRAVRDTLAEQLAEAGFTLQSAAPKPTR